MSTRDMAIPELRVDPRLQVERLARNLRRFGFSTNGSLTGRPLEARQQILGMLEQDPGLADPNKLGPKDAIRLRRELTRLCVAGNLHHFLAQSEIPHPVYNAFVSFEQNGDGPWDRSLVSNEAPTATEWSLFGIPIRFPLGVPASCLTANAEWVDYYARRGFNVITYKTVRSVRYDAHLFPNWVFIRQPEQPWRSLNEATAVVGDLETWPSDERSFSTANSIGAPSVEPDEWRPDVEAALGRLGEGQLLILSVMGSPDDYDGDELVSDFVRVAR